MGARLDGLRLTPGRSAGGEAESVPPLRRGVSLDEVVVVGWKTTRGSEVDGACALRRE